MVFFNGVPCMCFHKQLLGIGPWVGDLEVIISISIDSVQLQFSTGTELGKSVFESTPVFKYSGFNQDLLN